MMLASQFINSPFYVLNLTLRKCVESFRPHTADSRPRFSPCPKGTRSSQSEKLSLPRRQPSIEGLLSELQRSPVQISNFLGKPVMRSPKIRSDRPGVWPNREWSMCDPKHHTGERKVRPKGLRQPGLYLN